MSRILVVEDESTIADAILYALRDQGLQAEHCLLGRQALDLLQSQSFDVVILDVGLPDLTGFELCRELRSFSDVPVIFLTARQGEIDRVLGLELGGDDYMVKPFEPRELVARVRSILRRRARAADPLCRQTAGADPLRIPAAGRVAGPTRRHLQPRAVDGRCMARRARDRRSNRRYPYQDPARENARDQSRSRPDPDPSRPGLQREDGFVSVGR